MKRIACVIVSAFWLILLGFLLAGCAALAALDEDTTGARVVVEIATLAAIEQSDDRAETAARVVQAAEDARTWLDFDGVTVEQLGEKARERIAASDLELSSKAALGALVSILESEIDVRIGAGTIDAEARITVNRMLDWIVDAAQAYAG